MREPIFARPLSDAERESLKAALRSPDAFTLRRCQILLSSADGKKSAYEIASELGCDSQTVRNVIHIFNRGGLQAALRKGSRRPHTTPHKAFDEDKAEALRQMLHQSPRKFGKDSTLWTLEMAAQASFEEDLTQRRLSGETIRATLARMGVRWQRAKRWITSPDPEYERKRLHDRLIELAQDNAQSWAIGYQDECWWSRVALPTLHSFSAAGEPLRLVEQSVAKDDPDPKAISCYGLYVPELKQTWIRFVEGRPVSGITIRFLSWCSGKLYARGKKVWLLIWENAPWHVSKEASYWINEHNQKVKNGALEGVRIISCYLFAHQKSVAQRHGAQVDSPQTQSGRSR